MSLCPAGPVERVFVLLLGLLGSASLANDQSGAGRSVPAIGESQPGTLLASDTPVKRPSFGLKVEQLTFGARHHFFGYIGQCQTIPRNASGRYILGMEIDRFDLMLEPEDAATIILIDTWNDNEIIPIEETHAWNPQQGTMFYWNPLAPETQPFFNDRDITSGKVFTVVHDIQKKQRIRE
jgi:hypothetical protein